MKSTSRNALIGGLGIALVLAACRMRTAEPPMRTVIEGPDARCQSIQTPSQLDLMGWDAASRSSLSAARAQGAVVVRFSTESCEPELEVLTNCTVPLAYDYRAYNANDRVFARTVAELRSQMPVGAAKLLPKLDADHAIRADYATAGVYRLPSAKPIDRASLQGDCSRATHVVNVIYVGGFAMAVGPQPLLTKPGGVFTTSTENSDAVERLAIEGSPEACRASQRSGNPDEQCAVPLKLSLLSLNKPPEISRAAPSAQSATAISRPSPFGSTQITAPAPVPVATSPRRWCLSTVSLGNPTPMWFCETSEARCSSTMLTLNKIGNRITEACKPRDATWCHHRKYTKNDASKDVCSPSKDLCEASLHDDRWGGIPSDACAPIEVKGGAP
jgi:hypothetical protein